MRFSIKSFDFYKKLPMDLTETTTQGAVLSMIALGFMSFLFLSEVYNFLNPAIYSEVMMDINTDPDLRINFNMSFPKLKCDFAVVDVLDVLGTNRANITKNIMKWHLDNDGNRRELYGFNKEEEELQHDDHHKELIEDSPVVLITRDKYNGLMKEYNYVFIDFFVGWCSHCTRLAPTWDAFGKKIAEDHPNKNSILIGKVDCVKESEWCRTLNIRFYPFLQFFTDGETIKNYAEDRTVNKLTSWMNTMIRQHPSKHEPRKRRYNQKLLEVQDKRKQQLADEERPGCMMYGFVLVNRVPGNFHIEARSKNHNMNMADMSHIVHQLNFGKAQDVDNSSGRIGIKAEMEMQMGTKSISDSRHLNHTPHEAHHHFIKVVSTFFPDQAKKKKQPLNEAAGGILRYQLVHSSQVMHYETYRVPEAKFSFDISPMCMSVKYRDRHLYALITSILAIVGGTFTVVGVLDAILFRVLKPKMS